MNGNSLITQFQKRNYVAVSMILITALSVVILLNAYATALYLGHFSRTTLPYYFIISSTVTASGMIFLLPILEKTDKRPILIVQFTTIALLLIFIIFYHKNSTYLSLVYSFLFLVIASVFNANCWNFAAAAFEFRVFKGYVNQFLASSSIGAMLITVCSYVVVSTFGEDYILFLVLVMMLLNCLSIVMLKILPGIQKKTQTNTVILKYPLFTSLALFVALINVLGIFFNYQMMFILGKDHTMQEITQYMTIFYLFVSGGSFIAQLFSHGLLQKLGISMLFLIATTILFVLLIPTLFYPTLLLITILNMAMIIVYSSLVSLGRQVSLNALPNNVKNLGQILIKAVTNNLAKLFASLCLIIFAYRFEFYPYQIMTVLVLFAMAYFGYKVKQYYGDTLLANIAEKRFYLPLFQEDHDFHFLKGKINELLASKDINKISTGLAILRWSNQRSIPPGLFELFNNPEPRIRIKAYTALSHFGKLFIEDKLLEQLSKEKDIEACWYLLLLIYQKYPDIVFKEASTFLNETNPAYNAIAIIAYCNSGELNQIKMAISRLQYLIDASDDELRYFAALALQHIHLGNPTSSLQGLIADSNYRIAKQAIKASRHIKNMKVAQILVSYLGKPRVGYDAAQSLINYQIDIAPLLFRTCLRANTHTYKPAIRVLAQLQTATTDRCLTRLIMRLPLLYEVELAKQIAIRATKQPLGENLVRSIRKSIPKQLHQLAVYMHLLSVQQNSNMQRELVLRKNLVLTRLLCYLATLIDPQKILHILPELALKQSSGSVYGNQSMALEYMDWLMKDRALSSEVFRVLESKVKLNEDEINSYPLDGWTKIVLSYQENRGVIMDTVDKVFALRQSVIFSQIPAELLIALAEECQVVQMAEQEVIYQSGDTIGTIYMILDGEVRISRKNKVLREAKNYDFIGLLTLLSNNASELDIVVSRSSSLLAIPAHTFNQLTDDYPDILREISRHIVSIYYATLDLDQLSQIDQLVS